MSARIWIILEYRKYNLDSLLHYGKRGTQDRNLSRLTTKPTMWLCTQRRLRSAAQSGPSSLWAQWVAKHPSFLHADSEDSDQIGRMIWVSAGRTCHFVGFVMRRLIRSYVTYKKKCSPISPHHPWAVKADINYMHVSFQTRGDDPGLGYPIVHRQLCPEVRKSNRHRSLLRHRWGPVVLDNRYTM